MESRFLGEIPVSELINGPDLAVLVGLTAGTAINDNEPWLKFYDGFDNKTKFISKKPYRHSVSFKDLYWARVNYERLVSIKNTSYICRIPIGYGPNSEWNRLMYPICAPTGNEKWDKKDDIFSPDLGIWASYNQKEDLELIIPESGCSSWCRGFNGPTSETQLVRGSYGVILSGSLHATDNSPLSGWRPLLEEA